MVESVDEISEDDTSSARAQAFGIAIVGSSETEEVVVGSSRTLGTRECDTWPSEEETGSAGPEEEGAAGVGEIVAELPVSEYAAFRTED